LLLALLLALDLVTDLTADFLAADLRRADEERDVIWFKPVYAFSN
jgi:hypothetical protein